MKKNKQYLTEAFANIPIEWSADLKWFRASDGVPSNPRPVFIKTKENSYKNPGKIAFYDKNAGGWVKKIEKTLIKIQTPKCWAEILTEPGYKLFEEEYNKSNNKTISEDNKQYTLSLDYGDAWYDMLNDISDKYNLPKAVKEDSIIGNTILVKYFINRSDSTKFKNELKTAFDDIMKEIDPENPTDLSISQQLISWVIKMDVKNNKLYITFSPKNKLFEPIS